MQKPTITEAQAIEIARGFFADVDWPVERYRDVSAGDRDCEGVFYGDGFNICSALYG